MRLVQAFLCEGKTRYRRFNHRACALKHVQAYLSARDDRDGCFRYSRGPMRLVQACSSARKNSC